MTNNKQLKQSRLWEHGVIPCHSEPIDQKKPIDGDQEREPLILPRSICGKDNRSESPILEYPFKLICEIKVDFEDEDSVWGTGFPISKRCVITAAHVVHWENRRVTNITIYPGSMGGNATFGAYEADWLHVPDEYMYNRLSQYDYAALRLPDESMFQSVGEGYFGYDSHPVETVAALSGYKNGFGSIQKVMSGSFMPFGALKYRYYMDTVGGTSGAPLLVERATGSGVQYMAAAMHTSGYSCPNEALRIKGHFFSFVKEWRARTN